MTIKSSFSGAGRRFFFVLVMVFVASGILGIGGEILTRLLYHPDHWRPLATAVEYPGYYTYPPLKTIDTYNNEADQSVTLSFDENGLRNPAYSLTDAEILVLGDSFTSAVLTSEKNTLVNYLREKKFKVYNAGVDGFSTFKAYKLLEVLLQKAHPQLVILNFYLGNDFFDNMLDLLSDGKSSYSKLPGVPKKGVCSLSRLCQFVYHKIYLGFFMGYPTTLMELYALEEMDSMLNEYDKPMEESVNKTEKALGLIAGLLREKGIRFFVAGIPSKAQVGQSLLQIRELPPYEFTKDYAMEIMEEGYSFNRPDEVLSQICHRLDIPYYSLLNKFRTIGAYPLYFQINSHWNEEGQRVAAEYLSDILKHNYGMASTN